jgi:hypothetical protein
MASSPTTRWACSNSLSVSDFSASNFSAYFLSDFGSETDMVNSQAGFAFQLFFFDLDYAFI